MEHLRFVDIPYRVIHKDRRTEPEREGEGNEAAAFQTLFYDLK